MAEDQAKKSAPKIDPALAERYKDHARQRGYHFSGFEWLAARDPEFEKSRLPLVEVTYLRKNSTVPVKYKELIAAALLAYRGYDSTGHHIKKAMEAGASLREVLEVFELCCIPGGMPTLHFGIDKLMELEREHPELFEND